uniref:Putative reverse transcriptase, RNA-dependent DNA polymerase n=1 Tax=Tanacetum cinerariifolium TaxID=118510 RepID=A0A699GY42_TANCI|nr:putative reverse transcriptase, RNA-dependent DNA polymerase [Tanacetum cinerariifolium]
MYNQCLDRYSNKATSRRTTNVFIDVEQVSYDCNLSVREDNEELHDDELKRRVEEFIDKIYNGWKAEKLSLVNGSLSNQDTPLELNEHMKEQKKSSIQEETSERYALPPRANQEVPQKRYSSEKVSRGSRYPMANIAKGNLSKRGNLITCLIIYVDDMIVTGDDKEEITKLKKYLFTKFKMKDLGRLKYFLRIEVLRSKQGIFMCQKRSSESVYASTLEEPYESSHENLKISQGNNGAWSLVQTKWASSNSIMEDDTMYRGEYGDQYFHPSSYKTVSFFNQPQRPTQEYYCQGQRQDDDLSFDEKYDKIMSMIESNKEENQIYEASFAAYKASFVALETHVDRLLDQLNRDETYEPQGITMLDFDDEDEDEGKEQNEEFSLHSTNTMEYSKFGSCKDKEDVDDYNNLFKDLISPIKEHDKESVPLKLGRNLEPNSNSVYEHTPTPIPPPLPANENKSFIIATQTKPPQEFKEDNKELHDDELRRRVEEFIDKIHNGWKAEKLSLVNGSLSNQGNGYLSERTKSKQNGQNRAREWKEYCQQQLVFFGNVHKTFHVLAREKDCLVLMVEEVGRRKLGLILFEEAERKLEIVMAMVGEEVPYSKEVGGVENKSSNGSILMANGEECLDGWVGADEGEVKGGGVDFGVILLGEIPEESTGESGSEEFGV